MKAQTINIHHMYNLNETNSTWIFMEDISLKIYAKSNIEILSPFC